MQASWVSADIQTMKKRKKLYRSNAGLLVDRTPEVPKSESVNANVITAIDEFDRMIEERLQNNPQGLRYFRKTLNREMALQG